MGKRPAYPLPLPIPTWVTRTVHTRCNCSATSNSRLWQTPSTEWRGMHQMMDASPDDCTSSSSSSSSSFAERASERARSIFLFSYLFISISIEIYLLAFFLFLHFPLQCTRCREYRFTSSSFVSVTERERDEYYCLPLKSTTTV